MSYAMQNCTGSEKKKLLKLQHTWPKVDGRIHTINGTTFEKVEAGAVGGDEYRVAAQVSAEHVSQVLSIRHVAREEAAILILKLNITT